jgi:hypothetical protein
MSDVTRILGQIEDGDGQAAKKLLPLVYDELRKLAAAKMAQENPGQTLQSTARSQYPPDFFADANRIKPNTCDAIWRIALCRTVSFSIFLGSQYIGGKSE